MLTYLRITNFALIDDVEMSFLPGMNVLTGETGAGKSIILGAVSLLRGGRASTDLIRSGAEEARIEAIFSIPSGSSIEKEILRRLEISGVFIPNLSEEGILVSRWLGKNGRNRIYLSGQLVPASVLSQVCGHLIDISSQHEHQTLMEVGQHLGILDRSGVDPMHVEQMSLAYQTLKAAHELLKDFHHPEKAQREDFLRFQQKELSAAELKMGEEESLKQERDRLRFVDKLRAAACMGEEVLYGRDASVLAELGSLHRHLSEMVSIEPRMKGWASQLEEAKTLLEDVAFELRKYVDTLSTSPERQMQIDERLHLLSGLLRKYGPDVQSALLKQKQIEEELSLLEKTEERYQKARDDFAQARAQVEVVATALSKARRNVQERLGLLASQSLQALSMPHARLSMHISDRKAKEGDEAAFLFQDEHGGWRRVSETGWDRCELLFSPNVGEEARPLAKIASGGELSRVLLALKQVLGQADFVPTYVFDEVDSGIGGATADQVGKQLALLSKQKQLLCITHLPHIAAYADLHFVVQKQVIEGRTVTTGKPLSKAQRQEELARMLGGATVTDSARAHAKEMLHAAKHSTPVVP